MAKLFGPLLSMSAQKAIGKKLTYRHSKGQHLVQAHAIPSNPRSTAQTAQRDQVALAVAYWKHDLAGECSGAAWTTAATAKRRVGSGYQYAVSSITKMLDVEADPSYVKDCDAFDPKAARFEFSKVCDFNPGDEGGNFDVWVGSTPSSVTYKESLPMDPPFVTTSVLGDGGDIVFVQLYKDDLPRSGIHEITLVDGGGMGTDFFDNVEILGDVVLHGSSTGFPAYVPFTGGGARDVTYVNYAGDGTYHDVDLSAFVPDGAYAIEVLLRVIDNLVNQNVNLRKGAVDHGATLTLYTQVANMPHYGTCIVGCSAGRVIQMLASNTNWAAIVIAVNGWFI